MIFEISRFGSTGDIIEFLYHTAHIASKFENQLKEL